MGKPPPLAVRLAHRLCRSDICERFHKTALNEFYRVAFRKKVYRSIDELQADLDVWIREYNEQRPHQGRWCFGKNPDADLLGCNADDEGENDRGLAATDKSSPKRARSSLRHASAHEAGAAAQRSVDWVTRDCNAINSRVISIRVASPPPHICPSPARQRASVVPWVDRSLC
jgi:hypothetical protein